MPELNRPKRLALTLGDPNGIGPEIALKAIALLDDEARSHITVFGPGAVLRDAAELMGAGSLLHGIRHQEAGTLDPACFQPGQINAAAGQSTVDAASAAIMACKAGQFDAVIACPHHETAIHQAGIPFSGYPSLVARVCGLPEDEVFMLLVSGGLRILHVTLHESVRTALDRLTSDLVFRAVSTGVQACTVLGVMNPKIGVFGVNPHASEGGLFGPEDQAIVEPAVRRLAEAGLRIDGPHGADMVLAQRSHDLYVAMLHDQGHIPIKLLAPNAASALSIGADVLLSSVGHGSAMDIAWKGVASADALLRTIALISGLSGGTIKD